MLKDPAEQSWLFPGTPERLAARNILDHAGGLNW